MAFIDDLLKAVNAKRQDSPRLNDNQLIAALANGFKGAPLPTPENPDYDLSSFVQKYGAPDQSRGQHLTDEFKLPNHVTFSDQSAYSTPSAQGGTWKEGGSDRYLFTPSEHNFKFTTPEQFASYFKNRERKGTFVQLPDGRSIEGTR